MKNEIQTGKTNDVNLKTCRKLWAANLLSRQLPPHFVLCVYRRRVPSRRLANRPVRGALFLFYYIHCVSRPLAVQNTLQRRSLNDFFLEEQLCQLFERIPTGRPKTANLLVRIGQ